MRTPRFDEISATFSLQQQIASGGYQFAGDGEVKSLFDISSLAAESIGAAACALARYAAGRNNNSPKVVIDRRLAALWFTMSIRPQCWQLPAAWDAVGGVYQTSDGWIRLHTNHHREPAIRVLQCAENKQAVAEAVSGWMGEELETSIVDAGGCAAMLRSLEQWQAHPQGQALATEPLVHWDEWPEVAPDKQIPDYAQPLTGLKVLDLTRVLAGPTATRFLSFYGAEVLRIDPPHWQESAVIAEMTLGKRRAGLDLKTEADKQTLRRLLLEADVLVHGYRPGAMRRLGFDPGTLREINPRLIDVSLSAYGWSGPWAERRGFDTLVQMSSGINHHEMLSVSADLPQSLPLAALDYATGYMMAASVLDALHERRNKGRVLSARLSLARTAHLLVSSVRQQASSEPAFAAETEQDLAPWIEETPWGPARRLRSAVSIDGIEHCWRRPSGELRDSIAQW